MTTIPAKLLCTTLADTLSIRQRSLKPGALREALGEQMHELRLLAGRLGRAHHADLKASGCDAASAWWLVQIAATSNGRAELVAHLRDTLHPRADEVAELGAKDFLSIVRIVCGIG